MADGQVQINHGDILTQSSKLTALKVELETTLNNCNAQIQNLHDSGAFTGLSGTAFTATYQDWHVSAQKTVALMDEFGRHLTKTSEAFGQVDEAFKINI